VLKENEAWQVIANPDGTLTWVTPTGCRYTSEPFAYRPFTDGPGTPGPATPTTAPPPVELEADDDLPPF
jgi:hypothetical protein